MEKSIASPLLLAQLGILVSMLRRYSTGSCRQVTVVRLVPLVSTCFALLVVSYLERLNLQVKTADSIILVCTKCAEDHGYQALRRYTSVSCTSSPRHRLRTLRIDSRDRESLLHAHLFNSPCRSSILPRLLAALRACKGACFSLQSWMVNLSCTYLENRAPPTSR